MRTIARFRRLTLAFCAIMVTASFPYAQAQTVEVTTAPPLAPPVPPAQTNAETFVSNGVESFDVFGKRLVWHQPAYCPSKPPASTSGDPTPPAEAADPVRINRQATYGGFQRTIYARNDPRGVGVCNPYTILSNIVSDENYVYWLDITGLVRISVEAGPNDTPELLNSGVQGSGVGALALAGEYIYGYKNENLFRTPKAAPDPGQSLGGSGGPISNFQVDGSNLYYVVAGTLYRKALDGSVLRPIASGISGFYADGSRLVCTPDFQCSSTNYVYVAQGRTIRIYNNRTEAFQASTYTSTDAQATVYRMTATGANLFIFETRFIPCSPSPCFGGTYNDILLRATRSFGSPVPIYARQSRDYGIAGSSVLTTDGTFLFWKEIPTVIMRLAANAAELRSVDLYPTGIQITQGIQSTTNDVLLVQRRRTFVRVFVRSASGNVNGITMNLAGSWSAGGEGGGVLQPINSTGKLLAVQATPNPLNINHAFLFELPSDWTTKSDLQLRAEINPRHFPLEPNYNNNVMTAGPFAFRPSPRLAVQYIMFGYELNGTTYYPRLREDLIGNYSYIRRTYPLATTPGTIGDPSPGFRPNMWMMFDDGLSDRILQPNGMVRAPECSRAPFFIRDDKGNTTDNRNLCASAYINSRLKQIRAEEGLDSSIFMYGMISDSGGFPRGQEGGDRVSSGPAGPGWEGYYAAHEVGHSLNRPHPNSGSDDPTTTAAEGCGHSRSDPGFPYASTTRAPIGPTDNSVTGFDVGDPEVGAAREIKSAAVFNDYMSYCSPYWISDYTYRGMYDYMIANPSKLRAGLEANAPSQGGDWLSIYGVLGADGRSAIVHEISRRNEIRTIPPREDGPFAIELVGDSATLATYRFTPDPSADATALLSFGQVVPWVNGTRMVRIVHRASGRILAERAVSANVPAVSDVRLENVTEPVTGTATLRWTASDPDGDTMTYDVYWSRDGGATFQPIRLDRAAMRMQIDTTQLGGGSGIFRVVASDGLQTTSAQSAPITLAQKPPTVRITSPGDSDRFEWLQLINFTGDVVDLQDGTLADGSLVWTDANGATIGTGPVLTKADLPVGTQRITLTATNSAGQSASDSVLVTIGDNVEYAGATLSVAPAQLGWTSPVGSSAALTAMLDVSNTGGDSLQWTATSDRDWLTLDAASGFAPASLTVTADPTGMPANTIREGSITIATTVGGVTQTIVVPVNVSRGSAAIGPPPPAEPKHIYMPVLRR